MRTGVMNSLCYLGKHDVNNFMEIQVVFTNNVQYVPPGFFMASLYHTILKIHCNCEQYFTISMRIIANPFNPVLFSLILYFFLPSLIFFVLAVKKFLKELKR